MSSLTSWMAMTSKREAISAMQRTAWKSRFGESPSDERHFEVRPPKARMFHVATSRLSSRRLGGMVSSR